MALLSFNTLDKLKGVGIETVLYGFGQVVGTGIVTIPVTKKDAHGVAAAMTYAKRYSLSMALGIAADEDDDAEQLLICPKTVAAESQKAFLRALFEKTKLLSMLVFVTHTQAIWLCALKLKTTQVCKNCSTN